MLQDLRFSLRSLLRAKGFAVSAILTLAVGIGATTMVYSIVDGLLLRPLPFDESRRDRLITIHSTHPTQTDPSQIDDADVSYADAIDMRERATTIEALELVGARSVSLSSARESERVAAASITPGLFRMLGVRPFQGRDFEQADGAAAGFEQVAIISYGMWERLYGLDAGIIGQRILMNGRSLSIVGVMPRGFGFPFNQQIWLPLAGERDQWRARRGYTAVALLRDGVTMEQASADLNAVAASLAETYPQSNREWSAQLMPLRDLFVSSVTQRSIGAMFLAVALVMLAGCANIAGLLLTRGIGRQRELAVRASLGAGRGALVRLLTVESLILAVAGGIVGVQLAAWGVRLLVMSIPEPPVTWAMPALDSRALTFAALTSLAAAMVAGLVPAWRLSRAQSVASLVNARSGGQSADQRRLQSVLVTAQIALSLVLIAGALLLSRSVTRLQQADAGFDPAPLASFRFYVAGDRYDDLGARGQLIARVAEQLESLPGVEAATVTGSIPADDGGRIVHVVNEPGLDTGSGLGVTMIPATPHFWDTLGLRLAAGRTFTATETVDPEATSAIVGVRLARRLWPGEDAIGRALRVNDAGDTRSYRIVGVAPDVVYEELGEESEQSRLVLYVTPAPLGYRNFAALVRAAGDPAQVLPQARAALRTVDPELAMFDGMTMTARRDVSQWGERFLGTTFVTFAVIALLLACLGTYGLTAYAAAQRAREIGVRMAMGATRADILRLLIGRGVRLAAAGMLMGLPVALAAARAMRGMLFDISPWDAGVWITLPLVLIAAVGVANLLPAYRAARTDPSMALRRDT